MVEPEGEICDGTQEQEIIFAGIERYEMRGVLADYMKYVVIIENEAGESSYHRDEEKAVGNQD